jgi:hypothetical protein
MASESVILKRIVSFWVIGNEIVNVGESLDELEEILTDAALSRLIPQNLSLIQRVNAMENRKENATWIVFSWLWLDRKE